MVDILLNMEVPPDDPLFNVHYHADFIELSTLLENESGIFFRDIVPLYESEPKARRRANLIELNDDCLGVINFRESAYDDERYPFSVVNGNKLQLKEDLSNGHKLYIFFLLCSCTSYLSSSDASKLRRDFERVCKEVFSVYLPVNSVCHIMGKSGIEEQRYEGHITNKLDQLAQDLKIKTSYEPHYFSENNSGDGGLDIVAWSPFSFDDNLKFIQCYLGQCATGRDWVKKQDEPLKFERYLNLPKSNIVSLFIPYDGRNSDGTFNEDAKIIDATNIVLDRLRLMHIPGDFNFINSIPAFGIVNAVIESENDVI